MKRKMWARLPHSLTTVVKEIVNLRGRRLKAGDGFATGGEVGVVFTAEGAYAVEAVVAEDVAVGHGERLDWLLFED
jgi:hypothetical protein